MRRTTLNEILMPAGGQIIDEERKKSKLSFGELADKITLAAVLGRGNIKLPNTYRSPNQSTLSRIVAGKTARPSVDTLKALADALGIEFERLRVAFFEKEQRSLRVGVAHTIFGASALASLLEPPIEGLQITHLGTGANASFEPRFNTLGPTNRTLITPVMLDEEFTGGAPTALAQIDQEEKLDFSKDNGFFCLGANLNALWAKGEIDAAIASRDIFEDEIMLQSGSAQAVVCANLTRSVRGVAVVTLVVPKLAADLAANKSTTLQDQCKAWEADLDKVADFDRLASPAATGGFDDSSASSERQLKIWFPVGTFADQHARKFNEAISNHWGTTNRKPFNLASNPRDNCTDIFESIVNFSQSGVAMIVLWEPYTSYFRHQWDILMKSKYPSEFEIMQKARINSVTSAQTGTVDYVSSIEHSLGRYLGSKGIQGIPAISMDIIVRKSILNEKRKGKNEKFDTLLKFIRSNLDIGAKLSREVSAFSDNYDRLVKISPVNGLRNIDAYKNDINGTDEAGFLEKLSYITKIPKWRILKALAQFDTNVRFERHFLELFVEFT